MERKRINTSKPYDVIIGSKAIGELSGELKKLGIKGKIAIVTDDNVAPLYLDGVKAELADYELSSYIIPAGEQSKNAENFIKLLNFFAESGLDRTSTVLALGGGVVGDLAGFAAASYMRGVKLVQVATTLLAMVDSSVGGKTAIDLDSGKNLAGAFYQPELVICDTDFLKTLSPKIYSDGMAEIIKYGAIRSENILNGIKEDAPISGIISECVEIKGKIVSEDEKEGGIRALLNFGHTLGHSFEKLTDYEMTHGAAVALGMIIIARATKPEIAEEIKGLCKKYGLPAETDFTAEELYGVAIRDKKRSGDSITLVLPEKRGECILSKVKLEELLRLARIGLEA